MQLAEQVVLMPPQASRRISLHKDEIPRCAQESAKNWIATPFGLAMAKRINAFVLVQQMFIRSEHERNR
jgi:hypothetical protein